MTNQTSRTTIATLLAGLLVAGATVTAFAAAQPDGRRGPRGRHGGPGILRELDLSEDQRQQIRSLVEANGSQDTMERVSVAQRSLNEAVESGSDEGTIRQLAYDLGMAQGDAAVERARIHAQMMQILTAEQREEYEAIKAERNERMAERRERFEKRRQRRREPDPDSF